MDQIKCKDCKQTAKIPDAEVEHGELIEDANVVGMAPIMNKGDGFEGELSNRFICTGCLSMSEEYSQCTDCRDRNEGTVAYHISSMNDGKCKDHYQDSIPMDEDDRDDQESSAEYHADPNHWKD